MATIADAQTGIPVSISKGADVSNIIVDAPLTNTTIAYLQDQKVFIADKVFPKINVPLIRGTYFTFDKKTFMSNNGAKWRPGTQMNVTRLDVDHTATYRCEYHAVGFQLPEDLQTATKPLDMTQAAAEVVARNLLLDREQTFASKYFVATAWAAANRFTTSSFPAWSDGSASNPIQDVNTMKLTVFDATGFMPNTMILPLSVYMALQVHPLIRDAFKYTQVPTMSVLNEQAMANLFGMETVLVPQSVGYATETATAPTALFGKNVWMGYVAPSPGLYTNSAGYAFSYTSGTGGLDTAVRVVPDNMTLAQFVQGIQCYDMEIINNDLGAFFTGAVA
jgi:hypothetical protein